MVRRPAHDELVKDGYLPMASIREWLGRLTGAGMDVMVPVDKDGKVGYEKLSDIGDREILLHFQNSHRPPKDVVFPQTELLLRYRREKGADGGEGAMKVEEVRPEMNETVIFGIRPCDAKGIQLLDAVFSGANADPYYWDRRNKVLLVGLACDEPHYNCFCTTVGGSPHGTDGLDVLLTEIEGGMYALAVTPRGGEMVVGGPFEKASDAQRTEAEKVHGASVEAFARRSENGPIDAEALIKRLEGMFDDPYWDQTASRCLGCGACAYLCPTCHCFDINDEGGQAQGRRVRTWDTCQFADFTLHSSSHNPRPVKKNRIRQRVYHKFKYIPENLGDLGCVGCGRCITHCPVNIDIFKVLLDIEEVGP